MSKLEQYINYINAHILPFIDYNELDRSYQTEEKAYAKGLLNRLHIKMLEHYGDSPLICGHGDMQEGYVVVPGVIRGQDTGKVAVALLGIDLLSSGEHRETVMFCKYGVVAQGNSNVPKTIAREIDAKYLPYDYCYTANISGDIHISKHRQPDGIKEFLKTFQEHTIELLFEEDWDNETDMER